jgi:hypothetical protein
MNGGKKYLRRLDIGLVLEFEASQLEQLRPFLDKAGIPYEVLAAPPVPTGESETQRRRRSS